MLGARAEGVDDPPGVLGMDACVVDSVDFPRFLDALADVVLDALVDVGSYAEAEAGRHGVDAPRIVATGARVARGDACVGSPPSMVRSDLNEESWCNIEASTQLHVGQILPFRAEVASSTMSLNVVAEAGRAGIINAVDKDGDPQITLLAPMGIGCLHHANGTLWFLKRAPVNTTQFADTGSREVG